MLLLWIYSLLSSRAMDSARNIDRFRRGESRRSANPVHEIELFARLNSIFITSWLASSWMFYLALQSYSSVAMGIIHHRFRKICAKQESSRSRDSEAHALTYLKFILCTYGVSCISFRTPGRGLLSYLGKVKVLQDLISVVRIFQGQALILPAWVPLSRIQHWTVKISPARAPENEGLDPLLNAVWTLPSLFPFIFLSSTVDVPNVRILLSWQSIRCQT